MTKVTMGSATYSENPRVVFQITVPEFTDMDHETASVLSDLLACATGNEAPSKRIAAIASIAFLLESRVS